MVTAIAIHLRAKHGCASQFQCFQSSSKGIYYVDDKLPKKSAVMKKPGFRAKFGTLGNLLPPVVQIYLACSFLPWYIR